MMGSRCERTRKLKWALVWLLGLGRNYWGWDDEGTRRLRERLRDMTMWNETKNVHSQRFAVRRCESKRQTMYKYNTNMSRISDCIDSGDKKATEFFHLSQQVERHSTSSASIFKHETTFICVWEILSWKRKRIDTVVSFEHIEALSRNKLQIISERGHKFV